MSLPDTDLMQMASSLDWYHSIDLGNGVITNGQYDHRPYIEHYGIPRDLRGKTVLDIGAASGFFSFEFERRGAQVTATELPQWFDHDFGPNYIPDQTQESGAVYLHQPFEMAKNILGSSVQMKLINIYDITPETVGQFDLVFCGSVLIHLTDPIKALWNIAQVTKEKAIIATVIDNAEPDRPIATMVGQESGYCWWVPTRACLEMMAVAAGFVGIEWVSDFQLNYRGQSVGPYHGVLHAYKTTDNWSPGTIHRDKLIDQRRSLPDKVDLNQMLAHLNQQEQELSRLRSLVQAYECGRFMRFMRFLHKLVN